MQKANARKNQKGFTLIELLAVIVILAILAAIAIPSVVSIIQKQNDKAKVQDAVMIIHAAKLYVADHNITSDETMGDTELKDYLSKSAGDLPAGYEVYYTKSTNKYTIKDSDLSGISNFTGSSDAESNLIDYNN